MIRACFFGTPQIAHTCLTALLNEPSVKVVAVVTQPDRPVGRKQILTPPVTKVLATEHNIPVFQPENIKKDEQRFISQLQSIGEIDIAIVVAFGQILPENVLKYPNAGSINLHTSLLPRWRGAAPIQRAIMANDKETGVCLMQMEAGLDTGAVYALEKTNILDKDTFETLHDRLAIIGAKLICDNLAKIVSRDLSATPQISEGVTYAHKINNQDSIINWDKPAQLVSAQIRGLSPSPGAYTYLEDKRLKILACQLATNISVNRDPGEIHKTNIDSFIVACGDNSTIEVTELQLEGKKRMTAVEFLKGFELIEGRKLHSH